MSNAAYAKSQLARINNIVGSSLYDLGSVSTDGLMDGDGYVSKCEPACCGRPEMMIVTSATQGLI
jgi:hypothetical protein